MHSVEDKTKKDASRKKWVGRLMFFVVFAAFLIYTRETVTSIFEQKYFYLSLAIFIGLLAIWYFVSKILERKMGPDSSRMKLIESMVTGVLVLAFWFLFFHLDKLI